MRKFWNDGDMLAVVREEADKSGAGGGDGGGAGAPAAGSEAAPDHKVLQAEIERLKADNAEKETAVRYWHEKAKGGDNKAEPATKPDDSATEEDLIEVASKGGVKAVAALLKKQGFVSADEVESRIQQRAQQMATEAELASRYPELNDEKSEFFKETAKHYKPLVDQGVPKALAMKLAAQQAELEGIHTGKRKTAAQVADERKKQEADEKAARIKAQASDGRRGRSQEPDDDEGDNLSDFQKYLCEVMEIPEDNYKKRAREGVKVGGSK